MEGDGSREGVYEGILDWVGYPDAEGESGKGLDWEVGRGGVVLAETLRSCRP